MPRKSTGSRFLALPLEVREMIYPYVLDGVVIKIRSPPKPIFKTCGGVALDEIDVSAEEGREAATILVFPRALGILLVNRQIHAEVKDVPLSQMIGLISGWTQNTRFTICEEKFFDRLMALHHGPLARGKIKHLAIDTDVLDYFMHPAGEHRLTVRRILARLRSIIVYTREETFFARYNEVSPPGLHGLGMPTRPWILRVGARYSGNVSQNHGPPGLKKLLTEYHWKGRIQVSIEAQVSENKVCLVEIKPGWEVAVEVVHRKHTKVLSQWSLYKRHV